jgi:hypothetical protein
MFASKQCEDLVKKLTAALPQSLYAMQEEIQQQFREILQATFAHFDLIPREEFDVQVKVLARTREKVEALQKQLDDLLS